MDSEKGIITTQLLIIGGGPAGLSAGIEAVRLGVKVLLVDDKRRAGGQLVKQTHMFFGSKKESAGTRGVDIADQLIREFSDEGGEMMTGTMVIGCFDDGTVTALADDSKLLRISARKIIVASGAYENMLVFPGCDLPGVYGAGGFQTLMNVDGVLPGKNVLMVGAGNIGLIVSYQLMQAGGNVAAVIEAMPNVGGYGVHAAKIRRMGIPILESHTVKSVQGRDRVESATIVKLDNFKEVPGSEFAIDVDSVCLSVGLSPLSEILASAGCRMEYVPALGGYVPYHDENMMTSNENIFVAGDASGIEEASSAMVEGRIAGVTAAGAILDKDTETIIAEHKLHLQVLRGGPYGKKARQGKAELWGVEGPSDPDPLPTRVMPKETKFEKGKHVVVECRDNIPCNPCEEACRNGAIGIGADISSAPRFDPDKCNACGLCVTRCPGLAIFMVNMDYSEDMAEVTIPYEFLPVPAKGETWIALDRDGKEVGEVVITKVVSSKAFDRKHLVSFATGKDLAHRARHIVKEKRAPLKKRKPALQDEADPIVCRCEDVRMSRIEEVIDAGYHSFDEIKRITRAGMGPCQGKTCQRIIQQILSRKLGIKMGDLKPMRVRAPLKPVPFNVMAKADYEEE